MGGWDKYFVMYCIPHATETKFYSKRPSLEISPKSYITDTIKRRVEFIIICTTWLLEFEQSWDCKSLVSKQGNKNLGGVV